MKQKILIIEDEPGIRLPVKDELESEGFQVQVAEDGLIGLKSALEDFPDLIVLDLMLPGMSGLDVCRELRQKQIGVPIIMLTAKSQEIDRVVGLEIGADDYVTKPFSLRELLARIRAHLRNYRRRATAVSPEAGKQGPAPRLNEFTGEVVPTGFCNLIGKTVSHYRILDKLGSGGMGIVYKAEDVRLERPVALKFLLPHLSINDEKRRRFVQEAKAASAMDHPHLVTIYEIDQTEGGELFIAMAYYAGKTVKERIDCGPLRVQETVKIAIQVADGLAAAHRAGIVHRDIKPANLMCTPDGMVKIADFGLARLADSSATTIGAIMGTPAYLSPEQARGNTVDHRTDIWSLGVVLYEMLAGRLPFNGHWGHVMFCSVFCDQPQPISKLRTGIPKLLEQVVERALAKNPSKRYQSMEEMLRDLQTVRKTIQL